eukprot:768558-Hanusia_phi.AAC.2
MEDWKDTSILNYLVGGGRLDCVLYRHDPDRLGKGSKAHSTAGYTATWSMRNKLGVRAGVASLLYTGIAPDGFKSIQKRAAAQRLKDRSPDMHNLFAFSSARCSQIFRPCLQELENLFEVGRRRSHDPQLEAQVAAFWKDGFAQERLALRVLTVNTGWNAPMCFAPLYVVCSDISTSVYHSGSTAIHRISPHPCGSIGNLVQPVVRILEGRCTCCRSSQTCRPPTSGGMGPSTHHLR